MRVARWCRLLSLLAVSCLASDGSPESYTPDLAICKIIERGKHIDFFSNLRTVLSLINNLLGEK